MGLLVSRTAGLCELHVCVGEEEHDVPWLQQDQTPDQVNGT